MQKIILLGLMFTLCSLNLIAQVNQNQIPSCIKWDTNHIDLGKVVRGSRASADFKFKNLGKDPVNIRNLGCSDPMSPSFDKDPVLPGKSGWVSVLVWTGELSAIRHKSCNVELSNGETKIIKIDWEVVLPEIEWKPEYFDIGTITEEVNQCTESTVAFSFTNNSKEPINITSIKTDKNLEAEYSVEPVLPGMQGQVNFKLNTGTERYFGETAIVKFNTGKSFDLRVTWRVMKPTVAWKTTRINTRQINRGDSCTLRYEFTNISNLPVRISTINGDDSVRSPYAVYPDIDPGKTGYVLLKYKMSDWSPFIRSARVRFYREDSYILNASEIMRR